jgi:hypothetical protein
LRLKIYTIPGLVLYHSPYTVQGLYVDEILCSKNIFAMIYNKQWAVKIFYVYLVKSVNSFRISFLEKYPVSFGFVGGIGQKYTAEFPESL